MATRFALSAGRTSLSLSARSLLRVSRTGIILPRFFVQSPSSVRWASAATATVPRTEPPSNETIVDSPEPVSQKSGDKKHTAIEDDQPEFSTLKGRVSHDTLKAITVKPMKLKHMSPVQAAVLPMLPELIRPHDPSPPEPGAPPLPPRDLLVKARTGTGKTLAFLVPCIEARLKAIDAHAKQAVLDAGKVTDQHLEGRARRHFTRTNVGALIISPTRELATQIANEALKLTTHHDEMEVRLFVGGESKRNQVREWMRGRRDIVVGTPGRIRDLLESEPEVAKGFSTAKILVLDEADTLLEMGFRDDLDAITAQLPPVPERQTFLFSATVSRAIQQVARQTLAKNHQFINCVPDDAPPVHAHIPQYHTLLPNASHQIPHILRLLAHDQLVNAGKSKVILFLPTTKMTQLFATLMRELAGSSLPAGNGTRLYEIHSKRNQESRTRASAAFRQDTSGAAVLISSDVSARGVDYPGVTRVIQVGVPATSDQYVHRVGRTGRGVEGQGRADLVLLPWEAGFVTWQLTDIPLKPLTITELNRQVTELATKYDSNPKEVLSNVHPRMHNHYQKSYTEAHSSFESEINKLLMNLDEEAIKETLGSLLGYYTARSPELRVQKSVVVQGCKDWTVQACGLPTAPYVSESFLARLGASEDQERQRSRSGGGGKSWKGFGDSGRKSQRWEGRGSSKGKRRNATSSSW